MKILTILGARPQFIKTTALSRVIQRHPEIQEVIVHTGQYFDNNMSDVFFEEMEIPKPAYFLNINSLGYVLCTIHRQENTDDLDRLTQIINAINEIDSTIQVILPLHPRTKAIISKNNLKLNVKIIDPVGYLDMLNLTKNAQLVLTDSGGLQKEAFMLKKFCITLRDETEWVELVENDVNFLAGADY